MPAVSRLCWCGVMLALLLALPARASAEESAAPLLAINDTSASTDSGRSSLEESEASTSKYLASVGIGPAFSLGGGPVGLEIVARGLFAIPAKAATGGKASLWFVLPLRVNAQSATNSFGGFSVSSSTLTLALVPTVQATGALGPRLRGYAGVGAGVAYSRTTVESSFTSSQTSAVTVGEFDLISGVEYALDDRFTFIFEPVGVRVFTYGFAGWTALVGVNASL